jgi:hypothetical protein
MGIPRNPLIVAFLGALLFLLGAESVFAGFGITPPYVKNANLTRNSIYEQTIFLVRSDPVNDLRVEVFIDTPGIEDWFVIDKGREFFMSRGEVKLPMVVQVQVPDDAEFKNYTGAIRIRTSDANNVRTGSGAVSIALGAQIDVDITVIDKVIRDFRVRKIAISDLNAGRKLGWLYFPGKIRFGVTLENTGNVDVAPSSVEFDIYDVQGKELLEQTESSNNIEKVKPFGTDQVIAELPTRLPPGNYIGRYRIFNDEDVKQAGEVNLSIKPYGTVAASGYGFFGLSMLHKITIIAPLLVLFAILYFIMRPKRKKREVKKG